MKKIENNPMQRESIEKYKYPFMLSLRCGAKTRRSTLCLSPAVRGKRRCRMHGGAKGSGAPKGSQNALKHGFSCQESKMQRKQLYLFLKDSHELIKYYKEGYNNFLK